jgi:hypothetical protein
VGGATELERVLGELGETPFEPLKEEQEEGVAKTLMEHQVAALNNTLINFFRGSVPTLSHHLLLPCLKNVKSVREGTI